ncbi:techylectin-5B [Culex quinquefasciatus]|uniref:Techylectin-5B n=1 Tax=Culex quinquefasciatus TaxID=7176 RepID=B0W1M3_CULQU|nr:techylectin-5B [Culex quinquefasciatus]|eukprot:XP_001842607.1 techylectin-5B [Culex quinquefasciatus]
MRHRPPQTRLLLVLAVCSTYLISATRAASTDCGFGYELLAAKLDTLDHGIAKVCAETNKLLCDYPRTCRDGSIKSSGIYLLQPEKGFRDPFPARCEQDYEGGGWTVIQHRFDGATNFVRPWEQFKNGFGHLEGEFWLGLEKIHQLTYSTPHELHVLLEDFEGTQAVAKYEEFAIASEYEFYKLVKLGTYSGTAGDSLSGHKDHNFSTFDRDNDKHETANCATVYNGAWWHGKCHSSNLNGLYLKGVTTSYANGMCWNAFKGYHYSLKVSKMMVRSKM